jgi:hypothetical protein
MMLSPSRYRLRTNNHSDRYLPILREAANDLAMLAEDE